MIKVENWFVIIDGDKIIVSADSIERAREIVSDSRLGPYYIAQVLEWCPGQGREEFDISKVEVDHSDDPCPCGDPDCSRPFGHDALDDADARSIKEDELYHEAKDEGRLRPRSSR